MSVSDIVIFEVWKSNGAGIGFAGTLWRCRFFSVLPKAGLQIDSRSPQPPSFPLLTRSPHTPPHPLLHHHTTHPSLPIR